MEDRNNQTAGELFKYQLSKALNKSYKERQSRNVKRAMIRKAGEGYSMSRPPFGYKKTEVNGLFKPDRKGRKLQKILRSIGNGDMQLDTGLLCLESVVYPKTSDNSRKGRLIKMLINPYYAGYIQLNGMHFQGLHKALISRRQYRRIMYLVNVDGNPKCKFCDLVSSYTNKRLKNSLSLPEMSEG